MNYALPVLLALIVVVSGCTATVQPAPPAPEAPSVRLLSPPSTAAAGIPLTIRWRVDGEGAVQHTAVHYGPASVPSPSSPKDYPSGSPVLSGPIPAEFSTTITPAAPGTLYYRAHAIIAGANVWSAEQTLTVVAMPADLQSDLGSSESDLNAVS